MKLCETQGGGRNGEPPAGVPSPSTQCAKDSVPQMLAATFALHCVVRAAPRPNMILLMADDLGWGDVGFNNHTYARPGTPWVFNAPRTPNLDAMAAADSSLVFWRFYAGSGVCSPTRSAALTGRSPERECIDGPEPHGWGPAQACFSNMPLSPLTTTVAELAGAAGYDTLHLGKWHCTFRDPSRRQRLRRPNSPARPAC